MPESRKDLLDPKWKGEIIMPSPLSSGTANMKRFSFLALYGDAEGWKFIEALDKNIAFYTRSGNAPMDLVGRGEFTLGITSDMASRRIQRSTNRLAISTAATASRP
jgi:iron(III) transport system substrate-binding protein